ncbi:MAG: agmatinase, partial [Myxococcaceae bacterium]
NCYQYPMQLDGKMYPRFSGIKTFFRLPILSTDADFKAADVAILGVPFDGGTSYRPGARFAPEHVRSMSSLGRGYYPESDTHIFKKLKVGDAGDVQVFPQDIAKTHESIRERVTYLLSHQCFPMIIGGDHSTSIGSIQAIVDYYGPIGIVHFDAHTDAYPAAWGCDVHHGTFMRLGHERGWFQKDRILQIGIRGPCSSDQDLKTVSDFGYQVISSDDVYLKGLSFAKQAIQNLGTGPIYISFDVDCLDPAFAPGTGTPVPGGLTSFQALQLIRALSGLNIIGADIVEISPPYDLADLTSLVAVTIMGEILACV